MAKPLDERIAAAMGDGARAATVAGLIDEVSALIATTQDNHDQLDALSKSPTVSESEADKASDDALKLSRKITRLNAKRDHLQSRHEELLNSDRRRRAIEEHAQAESRRAQLVEDLRVDGPRILGELVSLLSRISASDAECAALNKVRAYGLPWLDSAEAEARGCLATFVAHGVSPIPRLVNMKIPTFDASETTDLAWPVRDQSLARVMAVDQLTRRQSTLEREKEAARWKRYFVNPPTHNSEPFTLSHRGGVANIHHELQLLTLTAEMVEEARAKGCEVRAAADNESIGTPIAAVIA